MDKKLKICFAASSGGHYEQLMMLKPLMNKYDSFVLTEKTLYKTSDKDIKTYYVSQVNRREKLFPIKMIWIAIESLLLFIKEKPDVIICTGVLAMIPMCDPNVTKIIFFSPQLVKISHESRPNKFHQDKVRLDRILSCSPIEHKTGLHIYKVIFPLM